MCLKTGKVKYISKISALLKHSYHSSRKIADLVRVSVLTAGRIKGKLDKKIPVQSARCRKCGRPHITPRDEWAVYNICVKK